MAQSQRPRLMFTGDHGFLSNFHTWPFFVPAPEPQCLPANTPSTLSSPRPGRVGARPAAGGPS